MPQISSDANLASEARNNASKKSLRAASCTKTIVSPMAELLEKLATEMSENLKRCMAFFYARE